MWLLWLLVAGFIGFLNRESFDKKVKRIDNDPNYKIKSNDWHKKHGK